MVLLTLLGQRTKGSAKLIPAAILISLLLSRAMASLPSRINHLAVPILATIVLAHGWVSFRHTRHFRDYLGQIMIINGKAHETVSQIINNANVLLLGFPYGYNKPTEDGNTYMKEVSGPLDINEDRPLYALVQYDGDIENVDYQPLVDKIVKNLRILQGSTPGYRVGIRPMRTFHALTNSIYDKWIYRSSKSFLAVLFHIGLQPVDSNKGMAQ